MNNFYFEQNSIQINLGDLSMKNSKNKQKYDSFFAVTFFCCRDRSDKIAPLKNGENFLQKGISCQTVRIFGRFGHDSTGRT